MKKPKDYSFKIWFDTYDDYIVFLRTMQKRVQIFRSHYHVMSSKTTGYVEFFISEN